MLSGQLKTQYARGAKYFVGETLSALDVYWVAFMNLRPDVCARAAEARGFESIWFPEHSHIPISRESPYPFGGELPSRYRREAAKG